MSKKSIALHFFAALLVLMYFLVARIPVALVIDQVRKNAPFMSVGEPSGSLWQGSLSSLSISFRGAMIDLGRTEWRIQPLHLLLGELAFHLHAEKEPQLIDADIALGIGKTLSVSEGNFVFEAANISKIYPIPGKIDGLLELTVKELALSGEIIKKLDASGTFKNAAYTLNMPVELGTYGARFTLQKDKLKADLSDVEAHVGLNGYATYDPKLRDYEVDVRLQPKNTANPVIVQSLSAFVVPQSDGSFRINKVGHL